MHRHLPVLGLLLLATVPLPSQSAADWQAIFPVDKKTLGTTGSNPYFNLTPGYQLSFRHGRDTDTLTVLNETKLVDGVETRVLEDREVVAGKLSELTRDYYAIDAVTNDVYYFGEDVAVFKKGKVQSHEGSWLSGVNGAHFGLMMPGTPKVGQRFYQEQAPGVGMDRAEIIADHEKISTPAGNFDQCLHVVETSLLEKALHDDKWYVAGIGVVRDSEMVLVKYGRN